ncbi:hypothetical protein O6H91_12G046600 [Diphasiastrum complanatum]|uniref:Uncharacterized protein n=1 Tax=Diphasiastrum complanatum TaxID=34168 RepID=A0ACC2C1B5_DIPCM|nr:hypothetical protein O6H91_12G046600 [Diphasiastrum complanatum]
MGAPTWAGAVLVVGILSTPLLFPPPRPLLRRLLRPRKCQKCLGVGNNLCQSCKGRGKQGGLFTGDPLMKCSLCQGKGRQLCNPCTGTGLSNFWLYRPVKNGGWGPRGS